MMDGSEGRNLLDLGLDKAVSKIISRLEAARQGAIKIEGSWGSFARLLASYVSEKIKRPILYISPHIDDADNSADDLKTFGVAPDVFPAWEGEEDLADATDEIRADRLRIALKLASGSNNFFITTSIQALCQPIPNPKSLQKQSLQLAANQTIPPEKIVEWLVGNNFERVDKIDLPGQFAHRGGIIDIFAPLTSAKEFTEKEQQPTSSQTAEPLRIEFFGDCIESIREINLDTQLSSRQLKAIDIVSALSPAAETSKELFLNLFPPETIVILEEPNDCEEVAKVFLERSENPARLYNWTDLYNTITKFTQLFIYRFAPEAGEDVFKVNVKSVQQFQRQASTAWADHKEALEQLVSQAKQGTNVVLYCDSSAEIDRVTEIIRQTEPQIPRNFKAVKGFIHQGFALDSLNTIVISHHELFGQFTLRRTPRPIRPSAPIDTLADLQEGDYVVHASYGIGKFLGVKMIAENGSQAEYLTIEYAGGVKIQASVNNISLVQKYIGTSPKRPPLSKVGSKKWQKQKEKVAKSVQDLAAELLNIQAKRQALGGIAFGADSKWQMEFEESFPYQETPDQITAVGEIKSDMQRNLAMDRLLCGDVGYGKTELAMRAAFKAVENGKQVAVLVPTTVLSVQHGRTFTERFADFPIAIEVLNRFKTHAQAVDIVNRTRAGKVDILIGTHRLLSGDVGFKDLGLVIIDEEQRFGVAHKEKLKKLRVNVDVLTMTATPIPRTLHMSLLGLRDISSLATPPLDRRSIVTNVTGYNSGLIRRAILRELTREGQVFFLHNRVKTIDKKAFEIQKLLPEAKISIAHGQMTKSELEKAMIDFVVGETDVLVCTTIIESGLDIPNANTIFIDNADRFGLAELHQLRGRVGRYKHRAFAYLLLPATRSITPLAARRLKAIEEYSHLGAGFRIALRDLEIRGAGNILGAEQSGHIQLVGYQMYCDLLVEAVRKMKNEPTEPVPTAVIDIGLATYISKNYIPQDRSRMEVYRKIAVARTIADLTGIEIELADVYGPVPNEIKLCLQLANLRIAAGRHDIKAIITSGQDLIFSFGKEISPKTEKLFKKVSGKIYLRDPKTLYLRLHKHYFEPQTLLTILRKILDVNRS